MSLAAQMQTMLENDAATFADAEFSTSLAYKRIDTKVSVPFRGTFGEDQPAAFPVSFGVGTEDRSATVFVSNVVLMAILAGRTPIVEPLPGDIVSETNATKITDWKVKSAQDDRGGGTVLSLRFERIRSLSGQEVRAK